MRVILIVAETISAQAGIGSMTMNAREFLQTDVVLVGTLLYALLGSTPRGATGPPIAGCQLVATRASHRR